MRPRKPASYSPKESARSNSGAESRQFEQRPSPISKVAAASRSPHRTHCGARVGRIAARQSWQTGILETLSSDVWQSLQSEGKRTEKTLCSRFKGARNVGRAGARRSRRVRVSVSLLLKTTLRSSQDEPPERSLVAGARGSGERWLTLDRSRSTVTHQYMCITIGGAMPDKVPVGGFTEISK